MNLPKEILEHIFIYLGCNYNTEDCFINSYLIRYNKVNVCIIHEFELSKMIEDYIYSLDYNGMIFIHEKNEYSVTHILENIEKINNRINGCYSIISYCCANTGVCVKYNITN
jgi:hypothetical protein